MYTSLCTVFAKICAFYPPPRPPPSATSGARNLNSPFSTVGFCIRASTNIPSKCPFDLPTEPRRLRWPRRCHRRRVLRRHPRYVDLPSRYPTISGQSNTTFQSRCLTRKLIWNNQSPTLSRNLNPLPPLNPQNTSPPRFSSSPVTRPRISRYVEWIETLDHATPPISDQVSVRQIRRHSRQTSETRLKVVRFDSFFDSSVFLSHPLTSFLFN